MADFNSKYSGEQVESLLDMVANGEAGGGGGGIAVEIDPIFSASPAASITEADKQTWSSKQDAISDLATIRTGAEKGATALQSIPEEYVTEPQLMWIKAEGETGVRLKGTNGTATGNLAISAGDDKTASDGTAFASAASGDHAVAFGYGNTCAGRSTLAQGLYNIVNGKDSVAFGQRNIVNGDQAFAAGQLNEVTMRLGVVMGYKNKATNTDSIAIGYQNTSSGSASVAMGDTCEANGTSSTAMGYKTKATGAYSSTFGQNTQATNEGEVAMGKYNKSTTSTDASEQTLFSFGVGTSDTNRINALEIKKNGDVYIGDELLSGGGSDAPYTSNYFSLAFFLSVYAEGGSTQIQNLEEAVNLIAAIINQKRVFIVSERGDNIPFFAESDGESVWFNFLSLGELYSGQISPGDSLGYKVSVVKGYMSGVVDLDAGESTYNLLPFVVNRLRMDVGFQYSINLTNPTGCLNPEWKMQIDCWNDGAVPVSFPSSVVWANDNVPTLETDCIYEFSFTQLVDVDGTIYHLGVWSKWLMNF